MTVLRACLTALILLITPMALAEGAGESDESTDKDRVTGEGLMHSNTRPSAQAKLAIIIDDIGYSAELGKRSLALPGAFTYAMLPMAPHSSRLASQGAQKGKEIILHTPMSNTRGLPLDPGALLETMTRAEFFQVLEANLSAIPEARGLNNHMGSLLTQKTKSMGWLMEFLQEQGLYFIDSRTSAKSRAIETAQLYQVPNRPRDVFLDHSRDPAQITRQIDRAIRLARDRGQALAIGHPYPETLALLEQLAPRLEAAQVRLVPASELLSRPTDLSHAESRCPAPPRTLWHRPQPQLAEAPDASHWWSYSW